ncbi:MAG: peptidylprolyl isomerase [Chitinophagaceae bacterium]
MKKIFLATTLLCTIGLFAQKAKPKEIVKETSKVETAKPSETIVEITTDFGVMTARLYNSTPQHRDNFIKLVKQGFYDSLLFHRVINGFMIQGGDPGSKRADSTAMLGGGDAPGIPMVPAEFRSNLIHKKGALAAARDNNAEKKSSNCQFYIVQGKKTDSAQLNAANNYTKEQKEIYQRIGGTPFLDQNYTVFGEVFIGLDVIDKIATTPCYPGDRPVKNVRMKIKILN